MHAVSFVPDQAGRTMEPIARAHATEL